MDKQDSHTPTINALHNDILRSVYAALFLIASISTASANSTRVSVGNIKPGSQLAFRNQLSAPSGMIWKDSKYCEFEVGSNFKNFSFSAGQIVTIKEVEETEVQAGNGSYIENVFVFSGSRNQALFSDETRLSANITIDTPYSASLVPTISPDFVGMKCTTKSDDRISIDELIAQAAQSGVYLNLK